MGKITGIGWTDHTFNGWWGCVKVPGAPECAFCYAETFSRRLGLDLWGKDADRRTFGDKHWKAPEAWNRQAQREGRRHRVFAMSMADWAEDRSDLDELRDRLFDLIRRTPWLDWQLLTKRIENVPMMLPKDWGDGYRNVWLGVTAGTQKRADEQIPALLQIPSRVRFVSAEPLLEEIDLRRYLHLLEVDWIIVGGESGSHARDLVCRWVRKLIRQGREAEIAVFVKQLGSKPFSDGGIHGRIPVPLKDRHGADPSEWPADLRVQQFPKERR